MSTRNAKRNVKRTGGRKPQPMETNLPVYLPGATEFTADPVMNNPDWVVQTLNALEQQGKLPAGLFDESLFDEDEGRKRMPGDFLKVLCGYVASKKPSMETFWNDYGQNPLWREAGFESEQTRDDGFEYRPSYDTFYRRAIEREVDEVINRFERAADELIQLARTHMPADRQEHRRRLDVVPEPEPAVPLLQAWLLPTRPRRGQEAEHHSHDCRWHLSSGRAERAARRD
jgi:hypothetical protein